MKPTNSLKEQIERVLDGVALYYSDYSGEGELNTKQAKASLLTAFEREMDKARLDEVLKMREVGDRYASGNDVSFEGLSSAYDAHILKRAADLTENSDV